MILKNRKGKRGIPLLISNIKRHVNLHIKRKIEKKKGKGKKKGERTIS